MLWPQSYAGEGFLTFYVVVHVKEVYLPLVCSYLVPLVPLLFVVLVSFGKCLLRTDGCCCSLIELIVSLGC